MTREMSAAAASALTEYDLARLGSAFGFMKGNAEYADIPHARMWQLDYLEDGIAPWRIVDLGAQPGESRRNVAITFHAHTADGLRREMETYGKAFRGIGEIGRKGFGPDLMADSRRTPPPAAPAS